MQQYPRLGKRSTTSRHRRLLFFVGLALVLTCFIGAFAFLPLTVTIGEPDAPMWAAAARHGKNAAFCASQLTPSVAPARARGFESIYQLAEYLAGSPTNQGSVAEDDYPDDNVLSRVRDVFDVEVDVGRLKVPNAFEKKALQLFPSLKGNNDTVRLEKLQNQPVVTVRNRHTQDMTYFNDIRRFRPGAEAVLAPEDESEITRLHSVNANAEACDFCSGARTAEDVFGRKKGPFSYTAANIAKLSAWHSLVVAHRHNPLAYDTSIIEDMVAQSVAWFEEVVSRDPTYQFGNVVCDIGKRASASQVHMHFQVWMTRSQFAAGFAKLHTAARDFENRNEASYWAALVEAHAAAGLVLQVGSAFVFPHLSPVKEKEIIVLEPRRTASFAKAVALVMVALRDEGRARSMSLGMALPFAPQGVAVDMPAIFRIIDRGNPLDQRGDTGGLEYFTSPYVGTDPYKVHRWLQRVLEDSKV